MPSSREYRIAETIIDKWDSTAALAISCPGGRKFVITVQPPDTSAITEPYCNFQVTITSVISQSGTAIQVLDVDVVFDVYGAVAEQVSNALGDIQATFSHGTLLANPTGGTFHHMLAGATGRIQPEMWKRAGQLNWNGTYTAKLKVSL